MSPRLGQVGEVVVFFYNQEEHQRPHVHVRGSGLRATVDIETGRVIAGRLPPRLERQVRRWVLARREALHDAYVQGLRHVDSDTIRRRFEERTRES